MCCAWPCSASTISCTGTCTRQHSFVHCCSFLLETHPPMSCRRFPLFVRICCMCLWLLAAGCRCEVGQILVNSFNVAAGLAKIEAAFPGDKDVVRQVTRTRLCLLGEGWRGNVEDMMDYDENGHAVAGAGRPRRQASGSAAEQSSAGSSVLSLPAPGADEVSDTPMTVSVSVVEVQAGAGPGRLADVSVLSGGGAEDQRRRK